MVAPDMDIGRLKSTSCAFDKYSENEPSALGRNLETVTVISSKQRLRVSVSLGLRMIIHKD